MSKRNKRLPKQIAQNVAAGEQAEAALAEAVAVEQEPTTAAPTTEPALEPEPAPEPAGSEATPTTDGAPATDDGSPGQEPVADGKDGQRYRTLQGIFDKARTDWDAERQSLHTQISTLTDRLTKLEEPAPADTGTVEPAAPQKLVTDADIEDFGADMIDMVRRVVQEAFPADALTATLSQLGERLTTLEQGQSQLVQTTAQSAEADYYKGLTDKLPQWQQINTDPLFLQWLQDVDPLSRMPRQAYLNDAFQRRDVEQTVDLMETWAREAGIALNGTPQPEPVPTPEPQPQTDPLLSQVQPQTVQASRSSEPAEARIWTPAEVQAFYSDVARGKFRNDPDQAAAIEAEIDLAVQQGRVRQAA